MPPRARTIKVRSSFYNLLMSERGPLRREQRTTATDTILRHYTDDDILSSYVTNNITAAEVEDLRPGLLKKHAYLDA